MKKKRTFVLFFALAACKEDVQLLPPMSIDGSMTDASSTDGPDAVPPMCHQLNEQCDVDRPCCASRCITPDNLCKGACLGEGSACTDSQQCCRLDCSTRGICEPPARCSAFGASCTTDGDCCCGICSGMTCMVGYRTPGQACPVGQDWHCSTGFCNAGMCQPNPTCRPLSATCTQNHDCCLGYCFMGHCENASCTP